MRLIDADALIKQLKSGSAYNDYEWSMYADGFIEDIENAPSIDIVRCKECKHSPWNVETDYTCVWDDDFADRPQTPDDFCSYGEREGE